MGQQFDITQLNTKQLEQARQMVRKRFPQLIKGYLSDADNYMKVIEEGIGESDLEKIAKNAHSIKSSSASLGVTGASEVAKALEEKARNFEDIATLSPLADLLKEALEISSPKLKAFLDAA